MVGKNIDSVAAKIFLSCEVTLYTLEANNFINKSNALKVGNCDASMLLQILRI